MFSSSRIKVIRDWDAIWSLISFPVVWRHRFPQTIGIAIYLLDVKVKIVRHGIILSLLPMFSVWEQQPPLSLRHNQSPPFIPCLVPLGVCKKGRKKQHYKQKTTHREVHTFSSTLHSQISSSFLVPPRVTPPLHHLFTREEPARPESSNGAQVPTCPLQPSAVNETQELAAVSAAQQTGKKTKKQRHGS